MKNHKPIIRRTFLQERFEILIKKQKSGEATFSELTELDEIVNRDPNIRFSILEELQGIDEQGNEPAPDNIPLPGPVKRQNKFSRLKAMISDWFTFQSQFSAFTFC